MAAGTTTGAARGLVVLDEPGWTARARAHEERVDRLTAGHRQRAGRKHPVEDFLFSYYSLRPAQLRRWHPGAGVALAGAAAQQRLAWRDHTAVPGGVHDDGPDGDGADCDGTDDDGADGARGAAVTLDVPAFLARRGDAVRHVRDLLSAVASRPVHLGCFGLHEWAMVYRLDAGDVRHAGWPLRLGPGGTDEIVESHRIRCSHFDAYRFFTAAARPLNALQPRREDQIALDQPGCLHANMDCYKWAAKLGPAVPGELLADAFDLAKRLRVLDMRAGPYDLTALGYSPVCIETPEGRAEYVAAQRGFADEAQGIRARLLGVCDRLTVLAASRR